MRKVGPTEFADLVALNALYRPGAMDQIPTYARGKRNPDLVEIADERLAPIIGPTYGVILYQEQAMQIAVELGDMSPTQANQLRIAMGKKDRARMAELRPALQASDELWGELARSSDWSFIKSHAGCYALISYRSARSKANHPTEHATASGRC